MTGTIKVYVTKRHKYAGVQREVGEEYDCQRNHLRVLIAMGNVTDKVRSFKAESEKEKTESQSKKEEAGSDEREELRAKYAEKFGKPAHGRMSVDSLKAALEAEES